MKAIIFDFDGVIHDTLELVYKVNVEISDVPISRDEYKDFFNGNIFDRKVVDKKKEEEDYKRFFELQNKAFEYLKIDEEIKSHLEKLAKEYALFIVSSNEEKALNIYFQNNNFTHIFKEILGAESHQSKVEKFKYLFNKYGLNQDDCIFVSDTLGDILEANKVGLRTIAVDFGFHERKRLEKGKPFKIVSSFDEIVETIYKL